MADCERPFFASTALGRRPVRCGKCIPCQAARRDEWAFRMCMESKGHLSSIFVTLTYSPENLPSDLSANKKSFQDFMKRYRKAISPRQVRFYACGEYGDQTLRPHYHAILFNCEFTDLRKLRVTKRGDTYYVSKELSELWPYGNNVVAAVNFETAAYVARYCTKKISGPLAEEYYQGRLPEFCGMSLKPGIAKAWFDKHRYDDVDLFYRDGFIVCNGRTYKIPKFYDVKFESYDPVIFADIKADRVLKAKECVDNSIERLRIREKVHRARVDFRKRSFESG